MTLTKEWLTRLRSVPIVMTCFVLRGLPGVFVFTWALRLFQGSRCCQPRNQRSTSWSWNLPQPRLKLVFFIWSVIQSRSFIFRHFIIYKVQFLEIPCFKLLTNLLCEHKFWYSRCSQLQGWVVNGGMIYTWRSVPMLLEQFYATLSLRRPYMTPSLTSRTSYTTT